MLHLQTSASPQRVIAGYHPPKNLSAVPDEVVTQAKRMLAPETVDRLMTFLKVE
jgi:hypothetical protein